MKTVTEKYHAVNEGAMSKAEFVRQMRLAHPQLISQFNGFNDSVQILKNKGLLFEKKEENEYENPSYNLSPDAVRRGLRYELILAGLDPAGDISEEDYMKAHKKAEDNIMKDQLHYYRMIADDKTKIEHDKMKETKRGAQETDTDNAMAKVKLKESKDVKKLIRELIKENRLTKEIEYLQNLPKGQVVYVDGTKWTKLSGNSFKSEKGELKTAEYLVNTLGGIDKPAGTDDEREAQSQDAPFIDETESTMNEGRGDLDTIIDAIENHAGYSTDGYNIEEALEEILAALGDHYGYDISFTPRANKNKLEAKGKDHDGDGDVDSDDYMAAKDKAIKKAMGKDVNEAEEKIKRALKKKIVQILKEGTLNEAATDALQVYVNRNDEHSAEAKALLDVIEAMEKDLMKHTKNVQDQFDKIGSFMSAGIFKAFEADYKKLNINMFLDRIFQNLPKSQKFEEQEGLGELEEKQTVFNENKKTK